MSACDPYGLQIWRYLDGRLQGQDLSDFRAHVNHCAKCRVSLKEEQSLSQLLQRSRPLYSAPQALRARVEAAVELYVDPKPAGGSFVELVFRALRGEVATRRQYLTRLGIFAATIAIIAMFVAFVPTFQRNVRAANYVKTAIATHRSYVAGDLSLELHSDSPEQVTVWFNGRVPFPVQLPISQAIPNSGLTYRLTGGSVVKYRGRPAALVTYQKPDGQKLNEKISLLVASADSAVVAGGEEIRSGRLTFHYRKTDGLNVFTWTDHGLSYALVSSISGSARESCMVCHQSMADRDNFNPPLK
jgi:anti-sigma factor RsiW